MGGKAKRNASGYLYVYPNQKGGRTRWGIEWTDNLPWVGLITTYGKNPWKAFATEREAALWVDKQLIRLGREPVNILVRKQA